ncbi:MAG: S26 family signal peptidase [Desulfobacteraceae bacterium]|nr:S26 family signal peptidase [Desulfobacteraceae bacterium]
MLRTFIRTHNLNRKKVICILAGYLSLAYAGYVIPERISISPTDSVGAHVFFYKRHYKLSDLHKDALVVIPLYTRIRKHCWPCLIVKYLRCDAGDLLEVKNHGEFFCNNIFLGSAKKQSNEGIPVKAFEYDGIIPEGKFFAMGSCMDSYDSRYVGLENKSDIKAIAVPLF